MILITGATGLIGNFLVRHLSDRGYSVRALVRDPLKFDLNGTKNIELYQGNINDQVSLKDAARDIETVIHSAALVSFLSKDKRDLYQTNVIGTENMVDLALTNGIKNFIHISSVGALGDKKENFINEESSFKKSSATSFYSYTKYLAELRVWKGHEEGLNTTILNPSVVLGPGDWNRSSTRLFKYIWEEKPYYTSGSINFVDVRDIAEVVERIMMVPDSGQQYILNSGKVEYLTFFSRIAEEFHKKPPTVKVTGFMIKLVSIIESLKSQLLNVDPLITRETARMAESDIEYDNTRLVSDLKIVPKTLDQSIEWVCRQLSKKYNLNPV